jgi:hypothetical protein
MGANLWYMYQPVNTPILTVTIILQIFTAFDPALICSPFSESKRMRLPMNAGTNNLGEMIAVASPYINGCTVGNVDTAPLQIEYGSGHRRIMQRSLSPSYFSVRDNAANLLSRSIRRLTNPERIVRET